MDDIIFLFLAEYLPVRYICIKVSPDPYSRIHLGKILGLTKEGSWVFNINILASYTTPEEVFAPVLEAPGLDTVVQMGPYNSREQEDYHLPPLLATSLLMQPRILLAFPAARAHCCLLVCWNVLFQSPAMAGLRGSARGGTDTRRSVSDAAQIRHRNASARRDLFNPLIFNLLNYRDSCEVISHLFSCPNQREIHRIGLTVTTPPQYDFCCTH